MRHVTLCTYAGLAVLMLSSWTVKGQAKTTVNNNQIWFGYMSSTVLSNKYSLWNDAHYVPDGFFIIRTGLTRNFSTSAITAGYAFAAAQSGNLERKEHRPWAQLQFNLPVNNTVSLIQRTRYEARFRQNIRDGEVVNDWGFTNRIRFLVSVRKNLCASDKPTIPNLSLMDEVLLNFGADVYSPFDQNRIALLLGLQRKMVHYQIGYMNRYVQVTPGSYVANHTLVLWVTHRIDLRKLQRQHSGVQPAND